LSSLSPGCCCWTSLTSFLVCLGEKRKDATPAPSCTLMVLPLTARNCSIGPDFDQPQANPVCGIAISQIFHKRNSPAYFGRLCGRTTEGSAAAPPLWCVVGSSYQCLPRYGSLQAPFCMHRGLQSRPHKKDTVLLSFSGVASSGISGNTYLSFIWLLQQELT